MWQDRLRKSYDSGSSLADSSVDGYGAPMSTVTEIKRAVARWLQTEMGDRLSDEEMMAIASEGARALDKREAAYAKRTARGSLAN